MNPYLQQQGGWDNNPLAAAAGGYNLPGQYPPNVQMQGAYNPLAAAAGFGGMNYQMPPGGMGYGQAPAASFEALYQMAAPSSAGPAGHPQSYQASSLAGVATNVGRPSPQLSHATPAPAKAAKVDWSKTSARGLFAAESPADSEMGEFQAASAAPSSGNASNAWPQSAAGQPPVAQPQAPQPTQAFASANVNGAQYSPSNAGWGNMNPAVGQAPQIHARNGQAPGVGQVPPTQPVGYPGGANPAMAGLQVNYGISMAAPDAGNPLLFAAMGGGPTPAGASPQGLAFGDNPLFAAAGLAPTGGALPGSAQQPAAPAANLAGGFLAPGFATPSPADPHTNIPLQAAAPPAQPAVVPQTGLGFGGQPSQAPTQAEDDNWGGFESANSPTAEATAAASQSSVANLASANTRSLFSDGPVANAPLPSLAPAAEPKPTPAAALQPVATNPQSLFSDGPVANAPLPSVSAPHPETKPTALAVDPSPPISQPVASPQALNPLFAAAGFPNGLTLSSTPTPDPSPLATNPSAPNPLATNPLFAAYTGVFDLSQHSTAPNPLASAVLTATAPATSPKATNPSPSTPTQTNATPSPMSTNPLASAGLGTNPLATEPSSTAGLDSNPLMIAAMAPLPSMGSAPSPQFATATGGAIDISALAAAALASLTGPGGAFSGPIAQPNPLAATVGAGIATNQFDSRQATPNSATPASVGTPSSVSSVFYLGVGGNTYLTRSAPFPASSPLDAIPGPAEGHAQPPNTPLATNPTTLNATLAGFDFAQQTSTNPAGPSPFAAPSTLPPSVSGDDDFFDDFKSATPPVETAAVPPASEPAPTLRGLDAVRPGLFASESQSGTPPPSSVPLTLEAFTATATNGASKPSALPDIASLLAPTATKPSPSFSQPLDLSALLTNPNPSPAPSGGLGGMSLFDSLAGAFTPAEKSSAPLGTLGVDLSGSFGGPSALALAPVPLELPQGNKPTPPPAASSDDDLFGSFESAPTTTPASTVDLTATLMSVAPPPSTNQQIPAPSQPKSGLTPPTGRPSTPTKSSPATPKRSSEPKPKAPELKVTKTDIQRWQVLLQKCAEEVTSGAAFFDTAKQTCPAQDMAAFAQKLFAKTEVRSYIKALLEVYRIVERIQDSFFLNPLEFQKHSTANLPSHSVLLSKTTSAWMLLEKAIVAMDPEQTKLLHTKVENNNGILNKRCGLCGGVLLMHDHKVALGEKPCHVTCANFWANRISTTSPF